MRTDRPGGRRLPAAPARGRGERASARLRNSVLRVRAVLYLLALDLLVIAGSFLVAAGVRHGAAALDGWVAGSASLLPVYVLAALNVRAYAPDVLRRPLDAVRRGLKALAAGLAALLVIVFYLKSGNALSRLEFFMASSLSIVLLATARYLFVRNLHAIVGGNPFCTVLILDGDAPRPEGDFSEVMPAERYFDPDRHDPMMYDRLAKALEAADRVVVSCPPARRAAWAGALRGANIQGEIAVPELAELSPLGLGARGSAPSVIVAVGPLSLADRAIKRVFDLAVALPTLVVLAPLLLAVALAVKLSSPGPILFRQTRIGRGNRLFELYKFRSMRADRADHNADRSVVRDDDRVTRVGRVIRSTSVDELPQLFNVLAGDMSIVGPRPHALGSRAASKLFWEVDGRYWDRHATKPGLTGLAQVRGFRGNTFQESDLTNRLEADLEYLENWSVWKDVKIILMTVRVLVHRNAF